MNRMGHDMGYRRSRTVGWTDIAALCAGLAIVALSFIPWLIPHSLLSFIGGDKAGHFAGYAVVGVLALYRRRRLASALLTAGIILYLGGVIELLQGHFNRNTDIADFAANGLGLALAGVIVSGLRSMRRSRRRTSAHLQSSAVR
ncbi:MAG: hypothetical protein GY948_20890 [Alphaproteobacteria bacterium]|nr:hypothetical protein [Alphaproteobacteria bacterium]